MTSTDLATTDQRQPPATLNRKTGKPLKVTGKLSEVLDLMVQDGMRYVEACKQVGLATRTIRAALDKPHVVNELRRRKQVFRAAISASNIHHLAALRDQGDNKMAALGAIKVLEQIDDDPASAAARNRSPGVVIQIINGAAHMGDDRVIVSKPLINNDAVSDDNSAEGD